MRSVHRRALAIAVREAKLDVLHLPHITENDYFAESAAFCPTVATLYDLIPLIMHTSYIDTWMDADRERYRLQCAGYQSATIVAAISESARTDALRLLSLTPSAVRTVLGPPLPFAQSRAFVSGAKVRGASAILGRDVPSKGYFLYCSGSGANKNLERQLEGYIKFALEQRDRSHSTIPLVIAGSQTEDTQLRLKARAFDAGLRPEELILCGYVTDEDLHLLQSDARALLSATLYEGYGLPAAESIAVGTPVIASTTSSYPEVVGDAGLLVDPLDACAIADALTRLAEDHALLEALSRRGLERAHTLFVPGRQAKDYLALYAEAAGS